MQVDLVRELVTRLVDAAQREGTLTEAIALQIEASFRQEYRGAEIVVGDIPRRRIQERRAKIVEERRSGLAVDVITKRHGVSRATLYRYLKRGIL